MFLTLFFIVHFPSLWSARCSGAAALAEHAIYHSILHSLMIAAYDAVAHKAWTMAAYLGLHFAWRIHVTAWSNQCSTLSPAILSIVMVLFVSFTMFIMMPLTPFASCDHLIAWSAADIASFLHPSYREKDFF
jgi:hypothetical protein